MPSVSSSKSALQAILSECGGRRDHLRSFAQEIVAELSELSSSGSENSLDIFISELVLAAADQRRRVERKQHQMECIAAAKARGVKFGRQPSVLPDDFNEYYQAWRDGSLSLREAAESCGMGKTSFQRAALRKQQDTELTA